MSGETGEMELIDAIADAVRDIVNSLRSAFPRHSFYYIVLMTTGEATPPVFSAWSKEALEEAVADEHDSALALKWSCADSPFAMFGDDHLKPVRDLFRLRPEMNPHSEDAWNTEYAVRVGCMVEAMARLDEEGVFGVGAPREQIVINVEVMPPDSTNVERARLLNPPEALRDWISEAAELE